MCVFSCVSVDDIYKGLCTRVTIFSLFIQQQITREKRIDQLAGCMNEWCVYARLSNMIIKGPLSRFIYYSFLLLFTIPVGERKERLLYHLRTYLCLCVHYNIIIINKIFLILIRFTLIDMHWRSHTILLLWIFIPHLYVFYYYMM